MKRGSLFLLSLLPLLSSCAGMSSSYYDLPYDDLGILRDVPKYEVNDSKVLEGRFVKWHGRYYYDEQLDATWMSFSGSGFEVTFRGTTLEADFYSTFADQEKARPFLAVAVDGDLNPNNMKTVALTAVGSNSNASKKVGNYFLHERIVLAHSLEDTVHTVRVYKKSEVNFSRVAAKSVATDGEILAVEPKAMDISMEVFGDSVTCGYAVESKDFYENFTTATENACKSFANIAANALNADVSLVSIGGYPIYKSKHSQGNVPDTIPKIFSLAETEWRTSFDHPWDNASHIPDVAVIALGANDGSILQDMRKGSTEYNDFLEAFKKAYIDFIDQIRNAYPNVLIVVSDEIVPFSDAIFSKVDEAYEARRGDKVIRAKYSAYEKAKDRTLPGQGHPNEEMQRLAGEELASLIRENMPS